MARARRGSARCAAGRAELGGEQRQRGTIRVVAGSLASHLTLADGTRRRELTASLALARPGSQIASRSRRSSPRSTPDWPGGSLRGRALMRQVGGAIAEKASQLLAGAGD